MHQKNKVSAHSHLRHWHHVNKKHRRRALTINAGQMSWAQVISLIGSIIAGVLLDMNKGTLAAMAGAFVILPGVFDMGGSLGASLSAKINHRLEERRAKAGKIFISSSLFTLSVALLAGLIVSLLGAFISTWFFDATFWKVFVLSEGAMALCGLIGFPLIGGLAVVLRKFGINPDDVVGPIESSVFDILTVLSLSLIAGWLL